MLFSCAVFCVGSISAQDFEEDQKYPGSDTAVKNGLSEKEISAILYMREEEKLARDVYRTLYAIWPSNVFYNIPVSEEGHMDVFGQLITQYRLEDPIKNNAEGVYSNPVFTRLFQELTKKGRKSYVDALKVGALIEDKNMHNLIAHGSETEKADLKMVYSTVLAQSQRHMAAFIRNLRREGGAYSPKYITQEQFKEALGSSGSHY